MLLIDDKTGLEVLTHDECLRLLAMHHLARIGLSISGRPVIFPINYAMDGDRLVFRTDAGAKLSEAVRGAFVAIEVDDVDTFYRTGWSVLVSGRAEEIIEPNDLDRAQHLPLRPWAEGEKSHWIRIVPTTITGRRIIHVRPEPTEPTPLTD